jgi:hemerythrin-like metal-binding protein
MAFAALKSESSVGVKSIDSQHAILFGYLNDLHNAMMDGQQPVLTGKLLRKLLAYTRTQFSVEEEMLAAAGYPGLTGHKVRHRELIKQIEGYAVRYERGEINLNHHLVHFLRVWLSNHIQKSDQDDSARLSGQTVH